MTLHEELCSPNVAIPETLTLLMEGFNAESEKAARFYFEQAVKSFIGDAALTHQELRSGYALFRTLNPQDDAEKIWSATFIVGHMFGMHNLSQQSPEDKEIGAKLLLAADDAMERIQKKRNSSRSAINIRTDKPIMAFAKKH